MSNPIEDATGKLPFLLELMLKVPLLNVIIYAIIASFAPEKFEK